MKLWSLGVDAATGQRTMSAKSIKLGVSVTAVAFAPTLPDQAPVLAVGFESGGVCLLHVSGGSGWKLLTAFPDSICHCSTVRRLAWTRRAKKASSSTSSSDLLLASCSTDHSVRVFRVRVE